jgi:protein-S-isoprenylcysteine O-methyltransferase Ste14
LPVLRLAGGALLSLGATALLDSFGRFAIQGIGTPAPVFPTRHLVITGLYRYVRNPMYVAVVSAILGQGLILGNIQLLEYGGVV